MGVSDDCLLRRRYFGWIGLYLYLSKGRAANMAFWAMVLSILGMALILPCWGVWSFAAPAGGQLYLQGQPGALKGYEVAVANSDPLAYMSLPVLLVGMVLFCVAVWRDNSLPKAAMIVLTICSMLIGPFLPLIGIMINGVVLAAAALWLAFSLWQRTTTNPRSEPTIISQVVTR